jgi:chromosome segregation ATPase
MTQDDPAQLHRIIAELQARLADAHANLEKTRDDSATADELVGHMLARVAEADDRHKVTEKRAAAAEARAAALEAEIERAREDLAQAAGRVRAAETLVLETRRLRAEIEAARSEAASAVAAAQQAQADLVAERERVAEIEVRATAQQAEMEAAHGAVETAKRGRASMDEQLVEALMEVDTMAKAKAEAERRAAEGAGAAAAARVELQIARTKLAEVEHDRSQLEKRLEAEHKAELERLAAAHAEELSRAQRNDAPAQPLPHDVAALHEEIEATRSRAAKREAELRQAILDVGRMLVELERREEEIGRQRARAVSAARGMLDQAIRGAGSVPPRPSTAAPPVSAEQVIGRGSPRERDEDETEGFLARLLP